MTHRLATNCAKNYRNWTPIVKVIVENVVTCFFGHSVVSSENSKHSFLVKFIKFGCELGWVM